MDFPLAKKGHKCYNGRDISVLQLVPRNFYNFEFFHENLSWRCYAIERLSNWTISDFSPVIGILVGRKYKKV